MPEISHFTARAGSPQARRALSPMFSGTAEATKTQTATVLRSLSGEPNGVGDYVSGARTIRVAKNQDVVIAGNPYERFYANHDGWLFRYKILHKGGRQIVDFVLPGDIFALQSCLFKSSLYSIATVTPRGAFGNHVR
jgi:hypothetical protein